MRMARRWVLCVALVLAFAGLANAEVKLHGLFSDGMVLQQGMKVPVWGTADDGEKVTVRFLDQEVSATTQGGKWNVKLEGLKAGGPFTMRVSGRNAIQLKDVYVGEVWVASGQSNMAMSVSRCVNAEKEVADSKNPLLRLYTVPRKVAKEPQQDVASKWVEAGPDTVGAFSAAGYFFGRDLQKALKVPVGIIHTSWGGTPAQAWTRREELEARPELKVILDAYAKALEALPKAMERYSQQLLKHKEIVAKATKEGKTPPRPPLPPMGPENPHSPAGLYNGMIAPLIPYGIAGAIWYQGESNAGAAVQYRTLFPTMIENWRKDWGQGEFPFLFVQLAAFRKISPEPQDTSWAWLREAQLKTLSLPKTGMAVITDVGEENDIHPKKKQQVGARLALAARALAYGEKIEYSGPLYKTMKVEGNKAVLEFTHVGGGLVAGEGTAPEAKGQLKGFAIAGADKRFVWANAEIVGDTIVVSSPDVRTPVAVRYAWADYPICNLYNKEGLPASPFRTDDFPQPPPPAPPQSLKK